MNLRTHPGFRGPEPASIPDDSGRSGSGWLCPGGVLLCAVVIAGGLVELPRHIVFGAIGASGLAVLTVASTAAVWMLWLARPTVTGDGGSTLVVGILALVWGLISVLWTDPNVLGLQNLLVFGCFLGCAALGLRDGKLDERLAPAVMLSLLATAVLAAVLYLANRFVGIPWAPGSPSPRTFAMVALLCLAGTLASWRMGKRGSLWYSIILIGLIVVSLSRMASATALLIFLLAQFRPSRSSSWLRLAAVSALLGVVVIWAVERFVPQERIYDGYTAVRIGELDLSTSGRINTWRWTWDSYLESPLLGHGAGSAAEVVAMRSPLEHPHSDYLRVLHDYGLLGFAIWMAFWTLLILGRWKAWHRAEELGDVNAHLHLAALLAVVATMSMMMTDNPLSYFFVLGPLGVIVGASMGAGTRSFGTKSPDRLQVPADTRRWEG